MMGCQCYDYIMLYILSRLNDSNSLADFKEPSCHDVKESCGKELQIASWS